MLDGMGRCAWAQAVEGCAVSGTIIGIPTAKDPENGNGQVAPEEVKRVQKEINMGDRTNRSNEQIERIKKDMKGMGDDNLRSIFAAGGDRELSMLAHIELLSRSNTPIVYEVKAVNGDEEDSLLKRSISSEYIDYLLNRYEEVRIRKVEIE